MPHRQQVLSRRSSLAPGLGSYRISVHCIIKQGKVHTTGACKARHRIATQDMRFWQSALGRMRFLGALERLTETHCAIAGPQEALKLWMPAVAAACFLPATDTRSYELQQTSRLHACSQGQGYTN